MINEEVKQKSQQVFQKAMDESFKKVVKEAVVWVWYFYVVHKNKKYTLCVVNNGLSNI